MNWLAGMLALGLVGTVGLVWWGMRWGARPEDRAYTMPGDGYLKGGARARVSMTRAISINAAPEQVWPWIAQLGRGAGWYSIDWLDNGRRSSARHIVTWIPEPRPGDATAIGYLRDIESGHCLAWWSDGASFVGSRARLVSAYAIETEGQGTRLISRISADAVGSTAPLALMIFRVIDSIMACRQLVGVRDRAQSFQGAQSLPPDPESGARDQYQYYEVLYARGDGAGVEGKETGAAWRRAAIEDGIIKSDE